MNLPDAIARLAEQIGVDPKHYGRPTRFDRPALPAGHPISWGELTRGTVLEGSPYPHPVFDGLAETRWTHRGLGAKLGR